MGFKWLVFLIRPLDLIGVWFGEDQRQNIMETHVKKERNVLCPQLLYTIVNTIGRTYIFT